MKPTLRDENAFVLALIQALLGAISQNFRRISIEVLSPKSVKLHFLLEEHDPADEEEIEDIEVEFLALQDTLIDTERVVRVDRRPLHEINQMPGRGVYVRKED